MTDKKTPAVDLQELVAKQLTDRRFAPVEYDSLDKKVTYVTARNGLFKITKTPIGLFKEVLQEVKTPIPGLPAMEAGVDLVIPKIPFKYILEALTYYVDINEKDKTEASVLFFWNYNNVALPVLPGLRQEGQLIIYCPTQVNSGTLSDFVKDDNVQWFRENTALLLETHSHNSMNAFFSGTDDANENNTQFYAVWGKVDKQQPAFAFRYVVGDTKIECSPDVLIDWPIVHKTITTSVKEDLDLDGDFSLIDLDIKDTDLTREIEEEKAYEQYPVKGPFKRVEYPKDWMKQHTKRTYTQKKTTGTSKFPYRNTGTGRNSYASYKQTELSLGMDDYDYEKEYWDEYDRIYGRTALDTGEEEEPAFFAEGFHGAIPSDEMTDFLYDVTDMLVTNDKDLKDFEV